jgi:5'-deoxynucleotidase YfbR-like HD superfamily hydrolase
MDKPNWLADIDEIDTLDVTDLARWMSYIYRFAGRRPQPLSVARHSVLVCQLMPEYASRSARLWALLHDAHECWTGDIPRPVHRQLGNAITDIQDAIDNRIMEMLDIRITPDDRSDIAVADHFAARMEWQPEQWHPTLSVDESPDQSACMWLAMYNAIRKGDV